MSGRKGGASEGSGDGDGGGGEDDDGIGSDGDGDDSGGDGDDSGGDGEGSGGVATAAVATAMAMMAMTVVATAAVSQYKTQPGRKDDEARGRVAAPHTNRTTVTSLKASSRRVPRASDVFGERALRRVESAADDRLLPVNRYAAQLMITSRRSSGTCGRICDTGSVCSEPVGAGAGGRWAVADSPGRQPWSTTSGGEGVGATTRRPSREMLCLPQAAAGLAHTSARNLLLHEVSPAGVVVEVSAAPLPPWAADARGSGVELGEDGPGSGGVSLKNGGGFS